MLLSHGRAWGRFEGGFLTSTKTRGAQRRTSAPATTSTAIETSALGRPTSMTGRSAPMARARIRSSTLLISAGALPSASARNGSQQKSGAGAAPKAWRPLLTRVTCERRRSMALALAGRSCCKRAAEIHSQLRRGWKCAYTQPHQDSATIDEPARFRLAMTALSLLPPMCGGARSSSRCQTVGRRW